MSGSKVKRILYFVVPLGFVFGLWVGAGRVEAEIDIVSSFETRCVNMLAKGDAPDLSGLEKPAGFNPEDPAKNAGLLSGGNVLRHLVAPDGLSQGCSVTNDASGEKSDVPALTARFDEWADAGIASGHLIAYERCTGDENSYIRVVKSVADTLEKYTLRIAMSADYSGPYFALTAAEDADFGRVCS